MAFNRTARRDKIRKRIRGKISGTAERPRLAVFRSNRDIYAQLIDDENGKTLIGVSSKVKTIAEAEGTKTAKSKMVGEVLAKRALEQGIENCVFDRGGFKYHGRIKALSDGAREGGLKF